MDTLPRKSVQQTEDSTDDESGYDSSNDDFDYDGTARDMPSNEIRMERSGQEVV